MEFGFFVRVIELHVLKEAGSSGVLLSRARPHDTILAFYLFIGDTEIVGIAALRSNPHFIKYLARTVEVKILSPAEAFAYFLDYPPVGLSLTGRVDGLVDLYDTCLAVGRHALIFCPGGARQYDIGIHRGLSKEEILQRVAALEFDRFLKYYENSADLNMRDDRRPERREAGSKPRDRDRDTKGRSFGGNGNYQRLFVNLGTKDGFYKASFLQFVLDMSDLKKEVLGKIDMKEMNSWIEIEPGAARKMIKAIDGKNFRGRKIRMNDAETGDRRK